MSNVICVISKKPVSTNYIPSELKGVVPLIRKYEVIKRTAKGYRLKVGYAGDKGSGVDHQNDATTYPIAYEMPVVKPMINIPISFAL